MLKNNKVYITPGLKDKFQLSEKTSFEVGNITNLKQLFKSCYTQGFLCKTIKTFDSELKA
ncbi:hypothetical protein ICE98_00504 [Lactococcus lactis]|nr:hypothetical protein [Lactococcus lactis]